MGPRTAPGTKRHGIRLAAVVATLAGLGMANAVTAAPAAAACNSTEIWVEVDGDRTNAPTNGCLGLTEWVLLLCRNVDGGLPEALVVSIEVCVAIPPN